MSVLSLLIGISIVVIALVIWLFFRMSQTGQFEDMETPARRIILDDDRGATPFNKASQGLPPPGEAPMAQTLKGRHDPPTSD